MSPTDALESAPPGEAVAVPLVLENPGPASRQPLTFGIPFARGALVAPSRVRLRSPEGAEVPVQAAAQARWPDGSVRWLLVDLIADPLPAGRSGWRLETSADLRRRVEAGASIRIERTPELIRLETGAARFSVGTRDAGAFSQVEIDGVPLLAPGATRMVLTDRRGLSHTPEMDGLHIEADGPLRATLRLEGRFPGGCPLRFVARLSAFAGTGLMRIDLTVHNPRRAEHPGGLWDLGDKGSMFFRDLSLEIGLEGKASNRLFWRTEPEAAMAEARGEALEIYQDSSGGERWQSENHVNHQGRVPCTFRGYRARGPGLESTGLRASPIVGIDAGRAAVLVAVPEFWQQFPKGIEVEGRTLRLQLFPRQFNDIFEMQGGEQKTHTVWLSFERPGVVAGPPSNGPGAAVATTSNGPGAAVATTSNGPGAVVGTTSNGPGSVATTLDWVYRPARARAASGWYLEAEAFPSSAALYLPGDAREQHLAILNGMLEGPRNFFDRREIIDEYGWRHWGEIYADHEAAYFKGTPPVISHYNNQYDFLYGLLLNFLRTGDRRWFDLAEPLARHVIDIDIYHTREDKAAYNGGLFWHTDHYVSAGTSTHRTFTRANAQGRKHYGGGPASQHNTTSGLLLYHRLTGSPDARDAVLCLADWVVAMEDGSRNFLSFVTDAPTGWATATFDFYGPGRGAGYSINALLDGWILTGRRDYLELAEVLIRRTVHPADDVAAYDLLNAELRWSYTIFLSTLARYLSIKADTGEIDFMYAWAQASLVRYATWMLDNEYPYFDRVETLEFPTETWAGQEMRKANVLRLAAGHVDDPLRSRLLDRGQALADRAWQDLMRFESRTVARSMAIFMIEGPRDAYFRAHGAVLMPRPKHQYEFGQPGRFVGQRGQVKARLKTLSGLAGTTARLLDVRRWAELLRQDSSIKP